MLYKSSGTLKYYRDPFKCIVEVSQDLADFYKSLIPKVHKVNRQGWPAHISVVRNRNPPEFDISVWGKYENEIVEFEYDPVVYWDEKYWWINCYSRRLEEIRKELKVLDNYEYIKLPSGYYKRWHITIGNSKVI
jgi:hypothetical protein